MVWVGVMVDDSICRYERLPWQDVASARLVGIEAPSNITGSNKQRSPIAGTMYRSIERTMVVMPQKYRESSQIVVAQLRYKPRRRQAVMLAQTIGGRYRNCMVSVAVSQRPLSVPYQLRAALIASNLMTAWGCLRR